MYKETVAVGAIFLTIGFVACAFGAFYAATMLAWVGRVPNLAYTAMGLGSFMTIGGIYACITGAVTKRKPTKTRP